MYINKRAIYMICKNAEGSATIVAMTIVNLCIGGAIDVIDVRSNP